MQKHGPERRRQWCKLHIGIDAQSLQIRAICVTSNEVVDAAVVADLLVLAPHRESIRSLAGDGAYDTQTAHEVAIQRGAIPVIPPRKNARVRKDDAFVYRMPAFGSKDVESVEPLPPEKLGGDQNELHQTTGRAGDVQSP